MTDHIFFNPRCSKCRTAWSLLEEAGVEGVEQYRYLDEPPTRTELEEVVSLLGVRPIEICRTKDPAFRALEVGDGSDLADDEVLELMAAHPKIIQRPILVYEGKAIVGRPPERVLDIVR